MDPATTPEGSSGKAEKKKRSKKAKRSTKVASVPEDENRQSAEALGQKFKVGVVEGVIVKNTKNTFEVVRSYVRQKPVRGLLIAFGVGVVAGLLSHD
jgi:ElaB/YqjD/DUF883 family membrane-anchored ribosome-binding protein